MGSAYNDGKSCAHAFFMLTLYLVFVLHSMGLEVRVDVGKKTGNRAVSQIKHTTRSKAPDEEGFRATGPESVFQLPSRSRAPAGTCSEMHLTAETNHPIIRADHIYRPRGMENIEMRRLS
jgi:hypothetical protein